MEDERKMWDELRAASCDLGNPGHCESSDHLINSIRKARSLGHDWAFISHATQLTGHRVRELSTIEVCEMTSSYGFKNWETWVAVLWCQNDYACDVPEFKQSLDIEGWARERFVKTGVFGDLVTQEQFDIVDWTEVYTHLL